MGRQIWKERVRFHFGHVEFEIYNSDSSGAIEQTTKHTNMEFGRVNLRVINIQKVFKAMKLAEITKVVRVDRK